MRMRCHCGIVPGLEAVSAADRHFDEGVLVRAAHPEARDMRLKRPLEACVQIMDTPEDHPPRGPAAPER
jgi:hypothetical protein